MLFRSYFNDTNRTLYIEFSTKQDGDLFYRALELDFDDVKVYSTDFIYEEDMYDLEENTIIDILENFLDQNDLPEQQNL